MDTFTLVVYYSIIALSFGISTFFTYIVPSIRIAREVADKDDLILGESYPMFFLKYVLVTALVFPLTAWYILTNNPEEVQDKIISVLLEEE